MCTILNSEKFQELALTGVGSFCTGELGVFGLLINTQIKHKWKHIDNTTGEKIHILIPEFLLSSGYSGTPQ